jgi:hypothetical protein
VSEEFPQYALKHDDGADITVDQVGDQVAVRQSSQGTPGRGPLLLTPSEGHELARQVEAAASAAARYTPPVAVELLPTNPTPDVATALRVLGITPETLKAIQDFAKAEAAKAQAAPAPTSPATDAKA